MQEKQRTWKSSSAAAAAASFMSLSLRVRRLRLGAGLCTAPALASSDAGSCPATRSRQPLVMHTRKHGLWAHSKKPPFMLLSLRVQRLRLGAALPWC